MLEFVSETGSTNADLLQRLGRGEGIAEGHWLIADRQTGGRGRQGRKWSDGAGNFMGSAIVHVGFNSPSAASVALVAGLAVRSAVEPYISQGKDLILKWPNDVLVGGAKMSGILLERTGYSVVVGVGVNLVSAPSLPDRQTCSVADVGRPPDRDSFAIALATGFREELGRWRQYGLEVLLRRWVAAAHPTGTRLTVHEAGGHEVSGEFAGLDPAGSLLLRLADGTMRAIHAGDITLTR
ncbi:biotin--[acetyl-CoA-carboxylase] ligase [Altererythrobacter sp. SALINAS58]|uniref:biotin--[acetyl-CoA-carboxylase] ligase n=1 Tax=Alteripontixanthobacter muriae TaxID=2705546 RepID=UPI001576916C|nr:biotin--[acetyl-CoA-carboxylase] ligase [Alteripontixanthobacter muriae]NTZ41604.1 biotin--[acetyl-CoA-carboxylase] ligase [Alteripontixanthobacter muriae]